MPPSQTAAKAKIKQRSWSSDWTGQMTARCTTLRRKRLVILIKQGAHVCAECQEARLEKWRLDDIEAERREGMWDAWDLAATGGERGCDVEARSVAHLGEKLAREHDPHAGQAADEGRVRVAAEHLLELRVGAIHSLARPQCIGRELAAERRSQLLGRKHDALPLGGRMGDAGELLAVAHAGALQLPGDLLHARGPDLRGRHVAGDEHERALGGQIEMLLQPRMHGREQVVQLAALPAGPARQEGLDEITCEDVQRLEASMGKKNPKTVNYALTLLSKMLMVAIEWNGLDPISRGRSTILPLK